MLNRFTFGLVLTLLFSASLLAADGGPVWLHDYQAALKEAQMEHKKLFLYLTGGNWCGVCQLADHNLFASSQFASYAQSNLVLLELKFDTPGDLFVLRSPENQTPYRSENKAIGTLIDEASDKLKKNGMTEAQSLMLKYGDLYHGVPTVFLLDSDGTKLDEISPGINIVNAPVANYLEEIDQAGRKKR